MRNDAHHAPAVRIRGLEARRGEHLALADVNADIPAGSGTVIIGPNGAGKTTLLLCIAGELGHGGEIRIGDPGERPPRMSFVPQRALPADGLPLTVEEYLSLDSRRPLWLGIGREGRRRAEAALEPARAGHLLRRPLAGLSGGEMRRVLLAAALMRDPELLLLDEPAAGVDVRGERDFWLLLDEMRRERGFTQIMVTHNLPLAAHFATHVLAVSRSVIAEGAPHKVMTTEAMLRLFGMPIHLYPDQCAGAGDACRQCGAQCGILASADALPTVRSGHA